MNKEKPNPTPETGVGAGVAATVRNDRRFQLQRAEKHGNIPL